MIDKKKLEQIKAIRKTREEREARNLRNAEKALKALEEHMGIVKVSLKHFKNWRVHQENSFYGELGESTVTVSDLEDYRSKLSKMVTQEDEILENLNKFEGLIVTAKDDTKKASKNLKVAEKSRMKIEEIIDHECDDENAILEKQEEEVLDSFIESRGKG